MGSCTSRDLNDDDSLTSTKGSKYIAAYGNKGFTKPLRYNDTDVILFSYNGDILTLKSATEKQEMPSVLSIRGFSQTINLGDSTFNTL